MREFDSKKMKNKPKNQEMKRVSTEMGHNSRFRWFIYTFYYSFKNVNEELLINRKLSFLSLCSLEDSYAWYPFVAGTFEGLVADIDLQGDSLPYLHIFWDTYHLP